MRVPLRFSSPARLSGRVQGRSRGIIAVSAVGTALGLCLVVASPVLLSGCGAGGGSATLPGNGVSLGRAAVLLGTFKGSQTLANGKVQETTIEFAPGSATETLAGSYTIRTLFPGPNGANAYVDFVSGTVAANILANGDLHLVFTPDTEGRSQSMGRAGRATESTYQVGLGGSVLQLVIDNVVQQALQRVNQVIQTYKANSIAGTYSGSPASIGGFEFVDPQTNAAFTTPPLNVATSMTANYAAVSGTVNLFSAAITLADPTTGTPYTATGFAQLYTEYDSTLPKNFSGITRLDTDEFFGVVRGRLPVDAPSFTITNSPFPVALTLANRPYVMEMSVGKYQNQRFQFGTLYVELSAPGELSVDAFLVSLLQSKYGVDLTATTTTNGNVYIPVGTFLISNGTTATPTPTPTPTATPTPTPTPSAGVPAVGTIQFSNVSSPTNAVTTKITDTDASASFSGNILQATLTEKNGHSTVERDLNMHFFAPDQASLAVGKTFTISSNTPTAAGQAQVTYIETAGLQKFWNAQSGTATVTAHDSQHTTFRITGAAMTPFLNAGGGTQPVGTFIIDAAGKF